VVGVKEPRRAESCEAVVTVVKDAVALVLP